MMMAGLDGFRNKIEPPEPIDKDLYDLPPDEFASVKQVPGSLPRCSTRWRPTTASCSRAACSRRT
jgi:glutamine synthetase